MGFDAINLVAKKLNLGFFEYDKRIDAEIIKTRVFGKECIFLKPQTYMNLSGISIRRVMNYYKMDLENVIIAYDDMDTPKKQIRIRKTGGSGGHNGVKSVLSVLDDFVRIRIGIGRYDFEDEKAKIDYVTAKISDEEKELLREGSIKAADAIIDMLENDVEFVMNKYNRQEDVVRTEVKLNTELEEKDENEKENINKNIDMEEN